MSGPPSKRRRTRAIGPDSIELAKALTHKSITTTNRFGVTTTKDVLVPLAPIISNSDKAAASSSSTDIPYSDLPQQDYDAYPGGPLLNDNENEVNRNKSKVSIILILSIKKLQDLYTTSEATRLHPSIRKSYSRITYGNFVTRKLPRFQPMFPMQSYRHLEMYGLYFIAFSLSQMYA